MCESRLRDACLGLLAVALAVQMGCDNPQIRQRMARRDVSIDWVVKTMKEYESHHPPSLRKDLARIEHTWNRDAARTEPNLEATKAFFRRDSERYDRRFKKYDEIARKLYTGHPDRAFDPLLLLF